MSNIQHNPTVEVLFPVGPHSPFIEESLNSLLRQTFDNWKLIAILDFGDEVNHRKLTQTIPREKLEIIEIATPYVLSEKLNQGLLKCSAKYVCRFDSDDVCIPERLEKQVRFLEMNQNQNIGLVGSNAYIINTNGKVIGITNLPTESAIIQRKMIIKNQILHPSVMFRGTVTKKFKYNESLSLAEDYDLWIRVASEWELFNLPEPLIKYRVHENNSSKRRMKFKDAALIVERKRELATRLNVKSLNVKALILLWFFKNAFFASMLSFTAKCRKVRYK